MKSSIAFLTCIKQRECNNAKYSSHCEHENCQQNYKYNCDYSFYHCLYFLIVDVFFQFLLKLIDVAVVELLKGGGGAVVVEISDLLTMAVQQENCRVRGDAFVTGFGPLTGFDLSGINVRVFTDKFFPFWHHVLAMAAAIHVVKYNLVAVPRIAFAVGIGPSDQERGGGKGEEEPGCATLADHRTATNLNDWVWAAYSTSC